MTRKPAETSRSIARNVLYTFSTWLLPLGLSFFATPILVGALGDEDYGIYALVLGFIGYSFNFGIGRAITKYIAEYRASGANEKIREVISATFFLNIAVGLTGAALICLLAGWLVTDVFRINAAAQSKSIHSFYIASATIFFLMLNQVFNAVLQGIHRFDVYSKIFNLNSIILLAGNIILALSGYGLLVLLGWNLLVTVAACLVYAVSARRLLPEFGISLSFGRDTLRQVLVFSSGVIGYQILANLLLLFERGWITRQLGAESLTYYVVPMILSLYIHSFISSLMLVIFPLASELKDDRPKLLRLYTKATKTVALLVVFLALTLIVENSFFLTLWMGPEFAERSAVLLVFHTITFGLLAILTVSWQMTEGLGYPNYNFKIFSVCLVLSVGLMVFLTGDYGNRGVAIARMTGFAAIFFSIFYVEQWFFKAVQVRLWLRLILILGVAAMLAAAAETLVITQLPVSWPVFLLSVLAGGGVYLAAVWLMGFITEDEKQLVKNILKR